LGEFTELDRAADRLAEKAYHDRGCRRRRGLAVEMEERRRQKQACLMGIAADRRTLEQFHR
jgi:hypothetical protein